MTHTNLHGITSLLKVSGERVTGNRLAVLKFLCEQSTPVTVKAIEAKLPKINIVTLYRILDYLCDREIVRRLTHDPKEQYFELADPYHRHHHHTICQNCGKVSDVECQLTLPRLKNFVPQMHIVTIYGHCKTCLGSVSARHYLPKGQHHIGHHRKKQ
jgi:Fe2+ or Zn2+ uptake regulation protein